MINFHPSYEKAELIHKKIIQHLETLVIPEKLKQIAYISNYKFIDIISVATAIYLAGRKLTSQQIEKQIKSFTQRNIENIYFTNEGRPSIVTLLCRTNTTASFNPFNGFIKVRGNSSFIDIYDLTVKSDRFAGRITKDNLDFHARQLQTQLDKHEIEILPDIETIKTELSRLNGIGESFTIQKLNSHLVLYEDVLPLCVKYIPNSVIKRPFIDPKYSSAVKILRQVTTNIKKIVAAESKLKSIAIMSYDSFYDMNAPTRKTEIPSASIRLQLHYENINNLLQHTIEKREIYCYYISRIPVGTRTNDEVEAKTIEGLSLSITKEIQGDIKIVNSTHKRRVLAKDKSNGKLLIDKVAKEMLLIIDKINPQDGIDIRLRQKKISKIKVENGGSFFAGHSKHKNSIIITKPIFFRIKDGIFTTKVELDESVTWDHDCLKIKPIIPRTITASLKDKLASEIIDHPIADMIGSVKSAKNKSDHTEVKFNLIMEILEEHQND